MYLDLILVEPEAIQMAGFEFTTNHIIIHTIVETIATILIEGLIFKIFCPEVKFSKVATINAITCIGLHLVYYYLANYYFPRASFPTKPTFQMLVTLLLTSHIALVTFLEIMVFLIEFLFYKLSIKQDASDKRLENINKGYNNQQVVLVENKVFGSTIDNGNGSKTKKQSNDEKKNNEGNLNRKIFLVTLLANFVAFFTGILISAGVFIYLLK